MFCVCIELLYIYYTNIYSAYIEHYYGTRSTSIYSEHMSHHGTQSTGSLLLPLVLVGVYVSSCVFYEIANLLRRPCRARPAPPATTLNRAAPARTRVAHRATRDLGGQRSARAAPSNALLVLLRGTASGGRTLCSNPLRVDEGGRG